jgi:hypothetical protein
MPEWCNERVDELFYWDWYSMLSEPMLNVIDFGNLLFVNEIIVVVENLGERF